MARFVAFELFSYESWLPGNREEPRNPAPATAYFYDYFRSLR